jgi:hypothetical protein
VSRGVTSGEAAEGRLPKDEEGKRRLNKKKEQVGRKKKKKLKEKRRRESDEKSRRVCGRPIRKVPSKQQIT